MTARSPLDELLATMLETWEQRYAFKLDREQQILFFARDIHQAQVYELPSGRLKVMYETAPDEVVSEECTHDQAAALVEAVLFRERLGPVPRSVWGG